MNKTILDNIQSVIDEAVSNGITAGINCLICADGKEIGYYEAGYSDIESKDTIKRDSLFRMYSMSKTVTSVATMILVEQGKLDLLDNVSKFIPSFSNPKVGLEDGTIVDADREIRIADLLNMTSGLPYPETKLPSEIAASKLMDEIISKMDTEEALSTIQIAEATGRNPLVFNPGSHWRYGFSADILGAIIEIASNMQFGDFLSKYIFEPLGMKDTGFYAPSDKISRLAKVYERIDNSLTLYTYPNLGISNHMSTKPAFESGGAGLVSCIDDFDKFAKMLLNNGTYEGIRIISPESVKYISSGNLTGQLQKDFNDSFGHLEGYSYGNLMRVMVNSGHAFSLGCDGEYGWDGWLGTYMAIDPANKITLLIMQQLVNSGTYEVTRKIRNVVYSAL